MNRMIGLVLLIAGIALLVAGYSSSQSFPSDVSKFFTGSVTDKAMWMILGGIVASIFGGVLLSQSRP